ncbi:MAG: DNA-binding response regulator [Bacteroidales bacterium]|nr:MAG: DNA-binding response regulator [Bacteroidales bacterium]
MNYIIAEDEKPTAVRLKSMIRAIAPEFNHIETFDSVSSVVKWLKTNQHPNLAFFDIQLADGLSFEIFEQVSVEFPVIFTTAFNEYAIKAFKVNSIDYLLKPVDEDELKGAVKKFQSNSNKPIRIENEAIAIALSQLTNTYKSRFLVKVGEHLRMIEVDDIALFISMEKSTFLRTYNGRDYGIDFTLEQIESLVDPKKFFRVNRKFIVDIKSIQDIIAYSNSRLKLKLAVATDEDVIVSRERVGEFKEWLEK